MKNSSRKCFMFSLTLLVIFLINLEGYTQPKKHNPDSYQFKLLPRIPNPFDASTTVIKQDFTLTLRDNVIMDCSKFYPNTSNPYLPNGYPTVIMVHGYGDRKETLEGFANAQAQYNYVVYTYSVRGQGNSGGYSNLISTTEAQDLIELVNFIRTDTATGLDTSKILITGGSQGGTLPYMAACMGSLKVKTIVSALSSPEFASSWIENGCIKMTLLWTIEYPSDTARYTPVVDRMSDWCYSSSKDKWDSLAYWLPLNRDFKNLVSQCTVPILMENCWQDKFFNAYGNISTMSLLTAPKRYYMGAVMGHGGDTSYTEDQWHMNFFNEWYYYWLWDIDNGILTRPIYHYASTTFPANSIGMWSFKHDSTSTWPPTGISNMKLYFNSSNKLTTTANSNGSKYVTLKNTVAKNYTMEEAVDAEFTGTTFKSKFTKSSLTFTSNALTSNMQMTGTPSINLDYASSAKVCQFNFQIYEVKGTTEKFINRINYTDRAYTTNQRKTKLVNGLSHSHIFKAGSKIKIVLTNLDTSPGRDTIFLGTNPFVLPVMTSGNHKLFLSSNSYINLPIKTVTSYKESLFTKEDTESEDANGNFVLRQNYPNPFNPITKISFSVPKNYNGIVSLKVYDIAGKEISNFVNNVSNSTGLIDITFDGSKFASGVYFYKLVAGNFSDIKKMILVK